MYLKATGHSCNKYEQVTKYRCGTLAKPPTDLRWKHEGQWQGMQTSIHQAAIENPYFFKIYVLKCPSPTEQKALGGNGHDAQLLTSPAHRYRAE